MTATSESNVATLTTNSLPRNNGNYEPVTPPSKNLGTDGYTPSIEVRPSTPTPNSRNTPMLTPDHTPDSERQNFRFYNLSLSSPSKPGTFSDTPILSRDRYDLNSTRTPSRLHLQNHNLNLESEEIRAHYQSLQFCRKWTSHLISHLTGTSITRNLIFTSPENSITTSSPYSTHPLIKIDDPHCFPPRADYPNELTILTRQKNLLQKNELVAAKSELQALTKHLISLPLPKTYQKKHNETDTLLYRVQTATSNSLYDCTTGIRCSGWVDSLYTSGIADERERDGEAFQSHCNYTSDPSPYISASTSVARIMRFIEYGVDKEVEIRVIVISLNRLEQLGIKSQSTEEYLERFVNSLGGWKYKKHRGRNVIGENEVSYVTGTHWLVEGWIPAQAIVSEMDCGEFLKIAEREGINRVAAMKYYMDKEIEARKIDLEKWPKRDV